MAQPKPVLIDPRELRIVESVRKDGIRTVRRGFEKLRKDYSALLSFVRKLEPGNFENRNYPELLERLFLEADYHIRALGDLDSRLGEAINRIEKGDQSVITKTVRRVELGTLPAKTSKRAAAVGKKS
jgi:hypothetical protein